MPREKFRELGARLTVECKASEKGEKELATKIHDPTDI